VGVGEQALGAYEVKRERRREEVVRESKHEKEKEEMRGVTWMDRKRDEGIMRRQAGSEGNGAGEEAMASRPGGRAKEGSLPLGSNHRATGSPALASGDQHTHTDTHTHTRTSGLGKKVPGYQSATAVT